MSFLTPEERSFLEAVSSLVYCNPFLPERIALEQQALGPDFLGAEPVWSMQVEDPNKPRANAWRIRERAEVLVEQLRERLLAGARSGDLRLYEDAVLYTLFYRYTRDFFNPLEGERKASSGWNFYRSFRADWERFLDIPRVKRKAAPDSAHIFACFFQIHRAFYHIFKHIIGSSVSAAGLRATVWESIFTHDMRRYRDSLYNRLGDFATLIIGPSGTGKELVARAIALSRYIPFDEKRLTFGEHTDQSFHPINLAALSPTLIESELFGHRRGAFTGALKDRKGWLEICPNLGSVFLDEIGDLDASIQVKLLRVIETRMFQPVGDTESRRFNGKLIAATNRDLAEAVHQGTFREDFYFRLCSDLIEMPSLFQQLEESPEVLHELVLFMTQRVAGKATEDLAGEAETWIRENLKDYRWPGNYRELEQCVRNVLIRGSYHPLGRRSDHRQDLLSDIAQGKLGAEELLARYCALVHAQTGSYMETARRLGLDRRTVKNKLSSASKQIT